ncbi:hypothetical protein TNCV_2177971 [Trichonephila clavipes]|uniref:Uncharacterized protein n=1 Tax=Trichonephila clavipes TaxID=2585209 RepID=A0A8X6VUA0_TRICX|nr:hypothetical protein TNCV_2177971 [Trichonephila clavipes]
MTAEVCLGRYGVERVYILSCFFNAGGSETAVRISWRSTFAIKVFKNCRKEDLCIVALELGETVAEKVTIVELNEIIKGNKYFKDDVEFVKDLIQYTIEDRKKAEDPKKMQKKLG